jgi:uncharacterized membrane protein
MTAHSHHKHVSRRVSPLVQRRLALAVLPFVLATLLGLVILWPDEQPFEDQQVPPQASTRQFRATVVEVTATDCAAIAQGPAFECEDVSAELDSGPDEGQEVQFTYARGRGTRAFKAGDGILVGRSAAVPADQADRYFFIDYQRSAPLLLLGAIFAVIVVITSRWRGLTALIGLALSMVIVVEFILPAILDGKSPLAVAIVGSSAIMFPALYLAHGINARTTSAVLGTLASLALTGALALIFVEAARFTGLSSEEATFLQVTADQINLQGLLLGGVIIGALGVLDDVTVTQASAVWELHVTNPLLGARSLYSSALRIGRDHIASTVNTLVLAYVGASLPLMILFTIGSRPLGSILTTEVIAEEIVRTLVGSIGLVLSVPMTTALTAAVVSGDRPRGEPSQPQGPSPDRPEADEEDGFDWLRPKAEMEWRNQAKD